MTRRVVGYDGSMTSIESPRDRPPAEGGDLPDAGPGAEHAEEHPLADEDPEDEGAASETSL